MIACAGVLPASSWAWYSPVPSRAAIAVKPALAPVVRALFTVAPAACATFAIPAPSSMSGTADNTDAPAASAISCGVDMFCGVAAFAAAAAASAPGFTSCLPS